MKFKIHLFGIIVGPILVSFWSVFWALCYGPPCLQPPMAKQGKAAAEAPAAATAAVPVTPTAVKAGSIIQQLQEPPAKKVKTDDRAINDARSLMKRVSDGRYALSSPEAVANAKMGLDLLKTCGKDEKLAFAKKLEQTKGNKSFAWVREFKESMKQSSTNKEGVKENYYTRNVMT